MTRITLDGGLIQSAPLEIPIQGYRIGATCVPNTGISRLNIRVVTQTLASAVLPTIEPSAGANAEGGTLTVSGADRQYEFNHIRLFSVQQLADRHQKRLVLDFAYDPAVLLNATFPGTLAFEAKEQLPNGNGTPSASFSIADDPEPYAAVRTLWQGGGEPRIDVCSVRNKNNSWMVKLIDLHDYGVNSPGVGTFHVSLGNGNEILVTNTPSKTNFYGIDAIESFGILHDRDSLGPQPADLVLAGGADNGAAGVVASESWHDAIVAGTVDRMARNAGGVGVQNLTFESGSVRFAQADSLSLAIDR